MRPGVMEIVRYSFNRLTGKWGTAILVILTTTVLSIPMIILSVISVYNSAIGNNQAVFSTVWIVGIYSIAILVVESAIQLGIASYFSRVALGEAPPFKTVFCRFKIWAKALGLMLFIGLFTFLWMLLFIVPGIIAALRYSMAPYLMAEYPDMGIREAVDRSKEIMGGNKGRLFGMELLLAIPSIILSTISNGFTTRSIYNMSMTGPIIVAILQIVVSVFVTVITSAAIATFYMNLTGRVLHPEGAGPQNWQPGNNNGNSPQNI